MTDVEHKEVQIKLECINLAGGDLEKAERLYEWLLDFKKQKQQPKQVIDYYSNVDWSGASNDKGH